jgi:hypothetical protein
MDLIQKMQMVINFTGEPYTTFLYRVLNRGLSYELTKHTKNQKKLDTLHRFAVYVETLPHDHVLRTIINYVWNFVVKTHSWVQYSELNDKAWGVNLDYGDLFSIPPLIIMPGVQKLICFRKRCISNNFKNFLKTHPTSWSCASLFAHILRYFPHLKSEFLSHVSMYIETELLCFYLQDIQDTLHCSDICIFRQGPVKLPPLGFSTYDHPHVNMNVLQNFAQRSIKHHKDIFYVVEQFHKKIHKNLFWRTFYMKMVSFNAPPNRVGDLLPNLKHEKLRDYVVSLKDFPVAYLGWFLLKMKNIDLIKKFLDEL